tara:strand:- start:18520 stop:19290 length:771 start_codon:yes stop_codon:yes gene_type:complete
MRVLRDGEGDLSGLDALVLLGHEPIFGIWTPEKAKRVWNSRVETTEKLRNTLEKLDAAERPGVLVSASGIAIYGDRGDEWLSEEAGKGKREYFTDLTEAWEREVLLAEKLGVRPVCARIGVVLGKDSPACNLFGKVFGMGLGGKLGSGRQWFSWIGSQDLTQMLFRAIEDSSISGPINCVSPNPVRNAEMTHLIGKTLNRPTLIPAPAFGVKLAFRELSQALLSSQRVDPAFWKGRDFEWEVDSIETAFAEAFGKA